MREDPSEKFREISVALPISVRALSAEMRLPEVQVIADLMELGYFVNLSSVIADGTLLVMIGSKHGIRFRCES